MDFFFTQCIFDTRRETVTKCEVVTDANNADICLLQWYIPIVIRPGEFIQNIIVVAYRIDLVKHNENMRCIPILYFTSINAYPS